MSKSPEDSIYDNIPAAFLSFYGDLEDDNEHLRRERSQRLSPIARFFGNRLLVCVGDITEHPVDAIVNAVNPSLMACGGVGEADGSASLTACAAWAKTMHAVDLPTGEAMITPGGESFNPVIIHAACPIYGQNQGREEELLAACYRNSLALARKHELMRVAFPAISTGIYGYPKADAARVVFATLSDILSQDDWFRQIRLVFCERTDADIFIATNAPPVSQSESDW